MKEYLDYLKTNDFKLRDTDLETLEEFQKRYIDFLRDKDTASGLITATLYEECRYDYKGYSGQVRSNGQQVK